jgi:uncharacterized protein (DUF427 family)
MTAMSRPLEVRGRVRVEQGEKRVRAFVGGELVADSTRPLLVWEKPQYPTYYFPSADVRVELLSPEDDIAHSPSRGDGRLQTLTVAGRTVPGAAVRYESSPFETLRDTVRLDWQSIDAWFEEDEQVFTHPRDPYTRVDVLASSRHVRVQSGGVVLAESVKPTLLFETGHPARYYLPRTDVRLDLLTPSRSATACPYKGDAEYWSFGALDDVAWSYPRPLPESQKIAGLVCFYPHRVDVVVDGRPIDH